MAGKLSGSRRRSYTKSRAKNRQHLQKPSGAITNRVTKVGGDRFAIVSIDPAKNRSEWMMADYFGKLLIEPQTLEHQSGHFKAAIVLVRQAQQEHQIKDTIVVVERTGNYHLAPKRAFASAGFETRVVHPFATKQYRMPADPGNKTDETDLHAQHRAAVAGFGLCERELPITYRELQLRSRHRRNLVEKSSSLACQIRDNLHLSMPGYAALFDRLLENHTAMSVGRCCESPAKVLKLGRDGICKRLRNESIRCNQRAIDKILSWASQSADAPIQDGALHHAIFKDLDELNQHLNRQITAIERDLASVLVQTPYVRLMAIPGINVVSAADLAAEMGPIDGYANANAITGRCGLFPSRHQSDQTDSSGPIIRKANRRLRCALMRIADNLAAHCAYYRGLAEQDFARGVDIRASRVKTAKKISRLAFACLAGDQPLKHPAFRSPDSILEKLREFHRLHQTPMQQVLTDLTRAVEQLPGHTQGHEATVVSKVLREHAKRKRAPVGIGKLLTAVLARLGVSPNDVSKTNSLEPEDRP
ncbi:IS110 family transposase [Rhodopirellula sallentina]|uniref:Transposase IS116/IS110/IS902 family protein n=1 Tax=Rhodopirellula sallentina SM41 TaxID=1263870 RepID=M5U6G2_9BACT|nr:transposase IS116/IS110/IS902 family protein [Rhodopirellula sallentina SM41]